MNHLANLSVLPSRLLRCLVLLFPRHLKAVLLLGGEDRILIMANGIRITVDSRKAIQSLEALVRDIETKAMRRSLFKIGNRYLDFLKRRWVRNASGGGQWKKLEQSTIDRKSRPSSATIGNPAWILREGDDLMNGMNKRVFKKTVNVGFLKTGKRHPRSKMTMHDLAILHASEGRNPIVSPSKRLLDEFVGFIQIEVNKSIVRTDR